MCIRDRQGQHNIDTYRILCHQKYKELPTDAWLKPYAHMVTTKRLLTRIVLAIMNGKELVVKIQEFKPNVKREMDVYRIIDSANHPNFAKLICEFSCNDNIITYDQTSTLRKGFCNGGEPIHLAVMPYYELGSTESTKLDLVNFNSIVGQVMLASIEMWYINGLVHNDLIPANVLLIENAEPKSYFKNRLTVGYGKYQIIISDFGSSILSRDPSSQRFVVKDILVFIEQLSRVQRVDLPYNVYELFEMGFSDLIKFALKQKLITTV